MVSWLGTVREGIAVESCVGSTDELKRGFLECSVFQRGFRLWALQVDTIAHAKGELRFDNQSLASKTKVSNGNISAKVSTHLKSKFSSEEATIGYQRLEEACFWRYFIG